MRTPLRAAMSCAFALAALSGCCMPSGRAAVDLAAIDAAGRGATPAIVAPRFPLRVAAARLQYEAEGTSSYRQPGGLVAHNDTAALVVAWSTPTRWLENELNDRGRVGGVVSLSDPVAAPLAEIVSSLRSAAARDGADLLLIYSIESRADRHMLTGVLSLITLGVFPETVAEADASSRGRLIDTRSGYVYGRYEASDGAWQPANLYTADDAEQSVHDRAERHATLAMLDDVMKGWPVWPTVPAYPTVSAPPPPGPTYRTQTD